MTTLARSIFWALICGTTALFAQEMPEMPEMPKPTQEHAWLEKFAGEWTTEMECTMEPGKEPMKGSATEKARMLGGFWLISDGEGEMMGSKFSNILTLGYDPEKKVYVGTWVDSMTSLLWKYEGTVNAQGTSLTLTSEGPCPMKGGKICKFRETMELKDPNHKVFTSQILEDDGTWKTMMTARSTKKG